MMIHLIEINKHLITLQKENLIKQKFNLKKVRWHNDFDNIKPNPSIIFANEFFDCLPIKQFIKKKSKWYEITINFNSDELRFFFDDFLVENKNVRSFNTIFLKRIVLPTSSII